MTGGALCQLDLAAGIVDSFLWAGWVWNDVDRALKTHRHRNEV